MLRKILACALLNAGLAPSAQGAKPEITNAIYSNRVREMDRGAVAINAKDADGHGLAYAWSIKLDETGKAYFLSSTGFNKVDIGIPWISESQAGSIKGKNVTLRLEVRHKNPVDGPETAVGEYAITIDGVKQPPVPRIAGNLGTSEKRFHA